MAKTRWSGGKKKRKIIIIHYFIKQLNYNFRVSAEFYSEIRNGKLHFLLMECPSGFRLLCVFVSSDDIPPTQVELNCENGKSIIVCRNEDDTLLKICVIVIGIKIPFCDSSMLWLVDDTIWNVTVTTIFCSFHSNAFKSSTAAQFDVFFLFDESFARQRENAIERPRLFDFLYLHNTKHSIDTHYRRLLHMAVAHPVRQIFISHSALDRLVGVKKLILSTEESGILISAS